MTGEFQIAQIETFLRVATEGSFTRAAIALNRTQSSVSSRIRALEDAVGARLFRRAGSSIKLTAAGEAFLPIAQEIVDLTIKARENVGKTTGKMSAVHLRLGANSWSSASLLPRALSALYNSRPDVSAIIEVHSTPELVPLLLNGTVELAFLNPRRTSYLTRVLWTYEEPSLLVGAANTFRHKSQLSLEDFEHLPLVSYTVGPIIEGLSRLEGALGSELSIVARSNSAQLVLTLITRGLGAGFLPLTIVEQHLAEGTLVELEIIDYKHPLWPVSLVSWPNRTLSDAAAAFVRVVKSLEA